MKRTAPYFALLLFTLLFYRNILFGSDFFIPWDLPLYHVPQAVFASQSLHNGHLPLWDPNTYCGRPLYAEVQAAYFYPFRILTLLFFPPSPHVTLLRAMEVELIFHVFLAGVFTLLLARRLGLGGPAALMSATAYCFGCYLASQAEHIGLMETAAWLPLALLGVILLNEKPTFTRFLLLSGTLTIMLLAGYTPSAILFFATVILLAVLWAVLFRSGIIRVLLTVAACIVGFLLAGIQMLPTMQLNDLSIGHLRYLWKGTGGGLRLEILRSLIRPNALGVYSWSTFDPRLEITLCYLYCGLIVVALTAIALFLKPSRIKLAIIIILVVSGVLMFGDHTPIGKVVFLSLPHFLQSGIYPENWMGVFSLAVALLGGFGLQQLAFLKKWAYVLVLLSAADLIWAGSNRIMNSVRYDPGSITLDTAIDGESSALVAARQTLGSKIPPDRIDQHNDNAWASWTWLTGVPSANGVDPLSITRLLEARQRLHNGRLWAIRTVEHIEPKLLSFLNVRYFMSRDLLSPADLSRSKFVLKASLPASRYFYENPNALPRFFFVRRTIPSSGEQDSIRLINRDTWDPAQEAVVEGIGRPQDSLAVDGSIQLEKYADEDVTLQVHTTGQAFLVTSETHYPGWRATLDGQETPIHYSNVAFRGVFVPPGDHRIVFQFRPAILVQGAAVSIFGVVILAIAAYFSGAGKEYWTKFRWFLSLGLFRAARAVRP